MRGGLWMAAERKVKCVGCDIYFYRSQEENVLIKNRYWHKKCYEEHKLEEEKSSKAIKELEEYICKLFNIDYVNARIQKQIKDMISQYHFTYSGIHGTLKYWYEVKQNSLEKANGGIGIVPYVYEAASQYYETIFYAQQLNKDIDKSAFVTNERIITIHSPNVKRSKIKEIDLSFLEREDGVNIDK